MLTGSVPMDKSTHVQLTSEIIHKQDHYCGNEIRDSALADIDRHLPYSYAVPSQTTRPADWQ